ncbi:hypothetical protein TWF718_011407 [Orbilia javanica]|uniref:Uncharacterized protein n=1 Tax=Orbilia javanica TaxID=47235 RepID=A0AAN8MTA3_9PEZI
MYPQTTVGPKSTTFGAEPMKINCCSEFGKPHSSCPSQRQASFWIDSIRIFPDKDSSADRPGLAHDRASLRAWSTSPRGLGWRDALNRNLLEIRGFDFSRPRGAGGKLHLYNRPC